MVATLETPAYGCAPEHTSDPLTQRIVAALADAGRTPAPMTGHYTPDCGSTGFLVIPHRPGQALVFHLVDGRDVDADRRHYIADLLAYAEDLRALADLRVRIGLVGAVVVTDPARH